MAMQVVMPIGGKGTRFLDAGIDIPKPLIDVLGKPMFLRSVESIAAIAPTARLIFVIRKDQNQAYKLGERIKTHLPTAEIVILQAESPGASSTVLAARDLLDPTEPLFVLDCDIAFDSEDYAEKIKLAMGGAAAGVLLSFKSHDPRYSFAKVDANGLVTETSEKRAISSNALMGIYFFTRASDFIRVATRLNQTALTEKMPEYYMSLTFNGLLGEGKKVLLASGNFFSFGTPEELGNYVLTGKPISS